MTIKLNFAHAGAICTGAFMLCALSVTSASAGAVIGNWSGSARSWNQSEFTTIKATMTGAGHTVEADEAITVGNLANNNMFIIGEATTGLSGAETTALSNWINGGGILWLGADTSTSEASGNSILSAVGSTMSLVSAGAGTNGALLTGIFASDGPPNNLVGQSLTVSASEIVMGGNGLAGDIVHWEMIGAGYVFASGDRFEHNFSSSTAGTTNGQFFLNIANQAMGGVQQVPEPGTLALFGLGLAGLGLARRRKAA